ncbi:MAG: oligosaccharide flippase family protein [Bacteroidaceae bacterium]|nr:oligosaccharide flippase family protein [Bacteroidaceae bacterium]
MKEYKSSYTIQAIWIGLGSLCSFLFSIVSAAILSRYLIKSDYGTYKQVMYVYSTLLSVFTLGLPLAFSYFLPRVNLAQGKTLVDKINVVFFILGLIFAFVLYFGAGIVADILKNKSLKVCIEIFSPAPIFILPTMGLQGILATYRRTFLNAIYVLISRVFMLLCVALPVAIYKSDVKTALYGFIIANFISCVAALYFKNVPFKGVDASPCDVSYRQIFHYSFPLMLAGISGIGIKAADQFYVSRYFGQEVFADFANGSLELPFVSMVLSAGGTVLLPVFSRMLFDNTPLSSIMDLWQRTAIKAALILYPLVVFCLFFALPIMTFVYGDNYALSADFFRIKLLVNFFTVVQFYPIILAMGKTEEYFKTNIIVLFLVWGMEYLSIILFNNAYVVTAVSTLCHLILILLMLNIVSCEIHIKLWQLFPIKKMLLNLVCCLLAVTPAYLLINMTQLFHLKLLSLIIGFITYSILLLIFSKILNIDYMNIIQPLIYRINSKKHDKTNT